PDADVAVLHGLVKGSYQGWTLSVEPKYIQIADKLGATAGTWGSKELDSIFSISPGSKGWTPSPPKMSYVGVIFDDHGRILMREPTNHFDGYVWSFPKGTWEKGELTAESALREVTEE